jgi:hypothetical protein
MHQSFFCFQSESVRVRQYQLMNWPDTDIVPQSSSVIVDLMNAVMHWQQQNGGDGAIVMQC